MSRGIRQSAFLVAFLTLIAFSAIVAPPASGASGDYIVVLRDGVSLQAHLKALKITPNRLYQYAPTGYEAVLNDTQYQRELNSTDVVIITSNATLPVSFEPLSKTGTPTQPPQSPTNGVKRIGGLL